MYSLLGYYLCICRGDRKDSTINSGAGGLRVRKFRQEDYHDDSEEDGTYNGNSTQQQWQINIFLYYRISDLC